MGSNKNPDERAGSSCPENRQGSQLFTTGRCVKTKSGQRTASGQQQGPSTPGHRALLVRAGTDLRPGARSTGSDPEREPEGQGSGEITLESEIPPPLPAASSSQGQLVFAPRAPRPSKPSPVELTFTSTLLSSASVPPLLPISGHPQGSDVSCGLRNEFARVLSPSACQSRALVMLPSADTSVLCCPLHPAGPLSPGQLCSLAMGWLLPKPMLLWLCRTRAVLHLTLSSISQPLGLQLPSPWAQNPSPVCGQNRQGGSCPVLSLL